MNISSLLKKFLIADKQNALREWLYGYDKFLTKNTVDTGNIAINSLGLVGGSFITDDPYTAYQPPTATSSEAQLLVIRGCLKSYIVTNDKVWLNRATLLTNALLKYFYLKSDIPDEDDVTWVPHWLVNVAKAFNARTYDQNGTLTFTNGVGTFTHNDLVRIYSVRATDATMEYDWAPTVNIVGTEYEIDNISYDYDNGTAKITLKDNTFSGDTLICYEYSTDEVIQVGQRCEAFPTWRSLASGECACAVDTLAWAINVYQLWYQITGDEKWERAVSSTEAAFRNECDISNAVYYLKLANDSVPVLSNGITRYSDRSTTATYTNIQGLIDVKYPISNVDGGQESFGNWAGEGISFTDDNYMRIILGSDKQAKIFVYIDEESSYEISKRWICEIWLKGNGISVSNLENIDLKPENFYQSNNVWWGISYGKQNELDKNGDNSSTLTVSDITGDINGINKLYTELTFNKVNWVQSIVGSSYGSSLPFTIKYKTNTEFNLLINDKNNNQWTASLPSSDGAWVEKAFTTSDFTTSSSATLDDLSAGTFNSVAIDCIAIGTSIIDIDYIGTLEKMSADHFANIGIGYDQLDSLEILLKDIEQCPQREELPYVPYVVPFDYHLINYQVSDLRGALFTGYQAPWIYETGVFDNKDEAIKANLDFLSNAQDYAENNMGTDGFFANVFYWNYKNDYGTHTPNTFSMESDWGSVWGGFQYRTIADVSRIFLYDEGNAQAYSIVKRFINGVDKIWQGDLDTFPTVFEDSRIPTNDQHDPQMIANFLKALILTLGYKQVEDSLKTTIIKLIEYCFNCLEEMQIPVTDFSNLVQGTFSPDEANLTWFEYWGGEIIEAISMFIEQGIINVSIKESADMVETVSAYSSNIIDDNGKIIFNSELGKLAFIIAVKNTNSSNVGIMTGNGVMYIEK